MVDFALGRIKQDDTKRRIELETLKQQVVDSVGALEEHRRRHTSRTTYHGEKLPVEIFGEIFGLLVASDLIHAIVVSHVCRHWRAVALSTPSLWRILVLAKKDPARKTREWIQRSQGRIRELIIRTQFEHSGTPLSSALQGFPWNHLRVCRLDHAASLAISRIPVDLSTTPINLVELEHAGWPGMAFFPYKILNPHLRSLTIKNQSLSWDVLSGLTKLVSLVVRNVSISSDGSLVDVLQANPMLEEIVLEVSSYPFTSLSQTLHHLTHLEIAGSTVHQFYDITMPSLRILRLVRVTTGADTLLTSMLDRGPLVLTELSIQSSVITSVKLVPFLRATLSLQTLTLTYVDGQVNTVVETLANQPSLPRGSGPSPLETIMCPRLAHITLSSCPDLKTGAVMRLVRSRIPSVTPQDAAAVDKSVSAIAQIETLIMDKCPLIEPEVLPWLRGRVRTVSCVYATGKDAKWKR
jgi:hypothetical protein